MALSGTMLVATAGVLCFACGDRLKLISGATASAVCLLAALTALMVSEHFRGPKSVVSFVLAGMMARMGIPLAAALCAYFSGGPLADAGFLYYLVVFYPVTLTVEIFLSWPDHGSRETHAPPVQDILG
jgi:hypothetical protein